MDTTKRIGILKKIVFLYLIAFPFGQLIRADILVGSLALNLHPVDILTGIIVLIWLISGRPKLVILKKSFLDLFVVFVFSLAFSLSIFPFSKIILGGFYLLRFFVYLLFPFAILRLFENGRYRKLIFNSLLTASFFVAVFGWIQYFLYPDFRPFVVYGWDDHLYRLIGTFFDPGFTGVLLALGAITSLISYFEKRSYKMFLLFSFLVVSLAFTYSRASYLALMAGVAYIFIKKGKLKVLLMGILAFLMLILLLPRPSSSGVQLERLYSVFLRITNYQETISIWKNSPVFGVGFNNLCAAREKFFLVDSHLSHSCSGSDSSLLLLLATTGFSGFIVFIKFLKVQLSLLKQDDLYVKVYKSSLVVVLVHSLFVNSLFYPWVMGYLGVLFALALSSTSKNGE
jgi:hypothetical protein